MSDKDNRTEHATWRKLYKARRKGQVPRSRDVSQAVTMFVLVLALSWVGPAVVRGTTDMFRALLQGAFAHYGDLLPQTIIRQAFATTVIYTMLPLLMILCVVAYASATLLGGNNFASEAVRIDFSKLNPVSGFQRLMNITPLVNVLKNLLVVGVLIWICWLTFRSNIAAIPSLLMQPISQIIDSIWDLLYTILFRFSLCLLTLAGADILFQRYKFYDEMKMTKQEVKDDHKETEGNPEIKRRIRQLQYRKAYQRMLQAVPRATAVVTNPTHYAVAIKYEPPTMDAPEVVAKGKDFLALKIKKIAEAHGVPVVENKPLAQTLYQNAEVGKRIPSMLYKAVAELLAYLYKQNKWKFKLAL